MNNTALTADNNEFASKPISSLIIKYSMAVMLGFILGNIYGIVDSIFVSYFLGTESLAAISAISPINALALTLPLTFSAGSATLIAIRLGEGNNTAATATLTNTVYWGLFSALLITVACAIFLEMILRWLGLDGNLLAQAKTFCYIYLISLFLMAVNIPLGAIMRVDNSPNLYMLTIAIAVVIVTALNPIFIYVFNWGIAGSAWAGVCADVIILVARLYYFRSRFSQLKLRLRLLPDLKYFIAIIKCGSAAFFNQLAVFFVFTLLLFKLVQLGGADALAAGGVLERILNLLIMPIIAISFGAQPILGYNYGAGNRTRLRQTLRKAIIIATIFSTGFFVICQVFTNQIISWFFLDGMALLYAIDGLRVCTYSFPILGFEIVTSEYFPAVYSPGIGVFLTILRQVIFLIPLMLILAYYWQIYGLWLAFAVSDVLTIFITVIFLIRHFRQQNFI